MLEGLDAIDWSAYTHAYGPADDVPALLRELASEDPGVRDDALWALHGNIWHQGTVYAATAPAVPFLIELAGRAGQGDRAEILLLLARIAAGASYLQVHEELEEDHPELEEEMSWVRAAHEAVGEGEAVYARLLGDEDPQVRLAALVVLSRFAARASEPLQARLEVEEDPASLVMLLLALAGAGDTAPVEPLLDHERAVVRAAAHLAYATIVGTIDEAGVALVTDPGVYAELVEILERTQGELEGPVRYLNGLDASAREPLVGPMLGVFEALEDPRAALDLVDWSLASAFATPLEPETSAASLSELQRAVLEAIAVSDAAWIYGGNVSYALMSVGLDQILTRQELFDYLDMPTPVAVMVTTPARSPGACAALERLGREQWRDVPFVFYRGELAGLDELIPEDPEDFPAQVMDEASQVAVPLYQQIVAPADRNLAKFRFYPEHTPAQLVALCRAKGWPLVEPRE